MTWPGPDRPMRRIIEVTLGDQQDRLTLHCGHSVTRQHRPHHTSQASAYCDHCPTDARGRRVPVEQIYGGAHRAT